MNGERLVETLKKLPKNDDGSVNYEDLCAALHEPCEEGSVAVSFISDVNSPVGEEQTLLEAFYDYRN